MAWLTSHVLTNQSVLTSQSCFDQSVMSWPVSHVLTPVSIVLISQSCFDQSVLSWPVSHILTSVSHVLTVSYVWPNQSWLDQSVMVWPVNNDLTRQSFLDQSVMTWPVGLTLTWQSCLDQSVMSWPVRHVLTMSNQSRLKPMLFVHVDTFGRTHIFLFVSDNKGIFTCHDRERWRSYCMYELFTGPSWSERCLWLCNLKVCNNR